MATGALPSVQRRLGGPPWGPASRPSARYGPPHTCHAAQCAGCAHRGSDRRAPGRAASDLGIPLLEPLPGSPLLDVVPHDESLAEGGSILERDQRGASRLSDAAADVGAVER